MYATWHQNNPNRLRRSDRSKNGCLTCRRRRVRCNQQRPLCGHCNRLRLDCAWSTSELAPRANKDDAKQTPQEGSDPSSNSLISVPETRAERQTNLPTPTSPLLSDNNLRPVDLFEYASFLWDDPSPPALRDFHDGLWTPGTDSSSLHLDFALLSSNEKRPGFAQPFITSPSDLPDISQLTDHFKQSEAPPILAPIETHSSWNLMRNQLVSMASTSPMVHYAILAFSSLQFQRKHDRFESDFSAYYHQCQQELSKSLDEHEDRVEVVGVRAQYVLAALFLLSYVDLVTNRTASAHVNLRKAFLIVSTSNQESWDTAEKTLALWLRLLDARAMSAGGEGLFLREENDTQDFSRSLSPSDGDAEGVLLDLLSQPSLRFFQKTQSFMCRISKIDQWHRSRGTVEDETEVMAIAAQIKKDNHKLYRHRHPLLDLAALGKLETPLLAQSLADRVTTSSRMALANYHATFIHLHRVAYRHLPRTSEVCTAMNAIRETTRFMVQAQGPHDSLTVNMLWPMLMWGAEEQSLDERAWILSIIRTMSKSISNAGITADVLQNLWQKQDESCQRVDIRSVMHDTFNSCFAIV